ncbi:MAG: flagellar biosynthetic protein FliO [Planctomycetes bacterium]|nr:flagellar biosynthetic protein FliO [Planctomycetota bacterium]
MIPPVLAMHCTSTWKLLLRIATWSVSATYLLNIASSSMVYGDPPGEPSLVRTSPMRVSDPNALPPPPQVQPAASWNSIPPRLESGTKTSSGSLPNASAVKTPEQQPLELKGPGTTEDPRAKAPRSPWAATLSMALSLILVVCLFLFAVVMLRKSQPKQFQKLPNEVIEVLGRSTMGPRQQLYVLRFGSKLILVSQQPGETQALGEITDQEESARLAGLCEAHRPESISNSFREVFRQVVTSSSKQQLPKTSRT